MDVDEFLHKNRLTCKELAKKCKIGPQSISLLKRRKHTPNLLTALILHHESGGEIELEALLCEGDYEKFRELASN